MAASDFAAVVFDLYHGVDQLSLTDIVEHHLEKLSLEQWSHVRNHDDETGVQRCPTVERKEIRSIVRDERVILLQNKRHQLPVLGTAKAEIIDMIGTVTCRVRKFEQGGMQTFVDQKFRRYSLTVRGYRATWMGFCFAQGRRAGRPRRGKAAT